MSRRLKKFAIAAVASLIGSFAGVASAANFVLPTPLNSPGIVTESTYKDATGNLRPALLVDNIPIAFKYDDFWSYSAKILDSIQSQTTLFPAATFGTYRFSTGTGNILLNISTVAGGGSNPTGIQKPIDLSGGGNNIDGWSAQWGGDPQTGAFYNYIGGGANPLPYSTSAASLAGGTTTVGEMLALLQTLNPNYTVPVLYADYNQSGSGDSLFMTAQVRIINPTTGLAVAGGSWQLDAVTNTAWDQNAPTYNFGEITFEGSSLACDDPSEQWNPATGLGCAGVTNSGNTYSGSHNKGSGQPDFMAFAPDMDLSKFDPSFYFVVTLDVGCLQNVTPQPYGAGVGCNTNGYEEFGIAGGLGPTNNNPEPSALALVGLGLAAAGLARRRRHNALK